MRHSTVVVVTVAIVSMLTVAEAVARPPAH